MNTIPEQIDPQAAPKVLFLAYYFPPLGGAGSQRTLKFAKYLPRHGFKVSVVSGEIGDRDRWAPADEAMCREIEVGTRIRRVNIYDRPLKPYWFRQLSENLGFPSEFGQRWMGAAIKAGRQMCEEERPDMIVATMSPFETSDAASVLSREFGIPWVADLRDPWALDEWQVYPSRWHRDARRKQMVTKLKSASLIIMNTPEAADRFRQAFPNLGIRVVSITNGYDAEDFKEHTELQRTDRFTIVHAGALHTMAGFRQKRSHFLYKVLGRTEEGVELLCRSHVYLVKALEKWIREDPGIRKKISLELIGVPATGDIDVVEKSEVRELTKFLGYLSHDESIREISQAGILFLPMHNMKPGARATIVPGKAYEYLASGRPILGAVPDGDCRDFLEASGNAHLCRPNDVDGILAAIQSEFKKWEQGAPAPGADNAYVSRFERAVLTAELAGELAQLRCRKEARRIAPSESGARVTGDSRKASRTLTSTGI